ncbi:hypothetical protein [Nocardia alni]|uniref:hypothetical protein n=1 Tax=Nocardia alni TaxID=2815723 RepID=UPI001C21DD31|nr:hypothetical protein [Nocardia alni]
MSDPAVPFGESSEAEVAPPLRWEYGGRVYVVWRVTDDGNGSGWELEDVGPAPGRGIVLEIFTADADGEFAVTAFTDRPLPFALVRRFVSEAAREIAAR